MGAVVLVARILLAAVFTIAGLSKLAGIGRTRESVIDFGVSAKIATPFAIALVISELAVAIALIPTATAWYGAIGAAVLLSLFSVAIAANLLRNHRPNCNCFGQLHSAPIGWPTFWRNVALAAVAGLLVIDARDTRAVSLFAWMRSLDAAALAMLAVAIVFLGLLIVVAVLLVQVLSQQGRMLLRFDDLERRLGGGRPMDVLGEPVVGLVPGTAAPVFALPDLDGISRSLGQMLEVKKPALLVFTNPNCGPCQALLPEIAGWQRDARDHLIIALISEGSADANREKVAVLGVDRVLLQREREVAEAYEAYGTPAAVVIAPDGRVASSVAQGGDAIRRLMLAIRVGELPLLAGPPPGAIAIGEAAPDLTFRTMSGDTIALAEFRGDPTLLLFWDSHCGFCQRMLPDLKAWEASAPQDGPRLLVVSKGGADDNRALDLRSTVVLDEGSRAAQAFGAHGTPMAVLLDREGRVDSDLAAGAQAVLALANHRASSGANGRVAASVR